jgi:hypothetical protein
MSVNQKERDTFKRRARASGGERESMRWQRGRATATATATGERERARTERERNIQMCERVKEVTCDVAHKARDK